MGWRLGQSLSCDWAWGSSSSTGRRESGTSPPPECWLTQKWIGGPGECGEDPLDLVGVGKQGVLVQPSIPCLDSLSSWTPSIFAEFWFYL